MPRFLLAIFVLGMGTAHAVEPSAPPPNIVLIISDDQGPDDYSFLGHPHIKTPHIDRLASQSLVYRRGHVPSSLCSPSLATILTGLYAHQHGVTSNDPPALRVAAQAQAKAQAKVKTQAKAREKAKAQPARDNAAYLAQRAEMIAKFTQSPTLPRLLAKQGYVSFQTGKWWGGDSSNGGFTGGMSHGDPTKGGRHGDDGLQIGRATMKPAFDFIDQSVAAKTPFFLWYAPMMPHSPHNPPERFLAKYRGVAPSLEIAKYWAMCEWFDETCGQLLEHLEKNKIENDTLVVYITDNGWIQDPDADRYAPRSKQSPFEGGLRTPILLRWPGRIAPAASEALASSIDLAPTLLKAAGLEPSPGMPGLDLRDEPTVRKREAIFGEIFTHNAVDLHKPSASLRFRWCIESGSNFKLIVPDPRNSPGEAVELFDLAKDPGETKNLASTEPAAVVRLRKRLEDWWPAND